MAFIRPATRQVVGCPRRGDPMRFAYIADFHLWSCGRPLLPQVSPPTLTADAAFEIPGLIAPWEFGQPLEAFLLRDAVITTDGRIRTGHAVLMFEDSSAELLPPTVFSPSTPGNPPAPPAAVTITSPSVRTHSTPQPMTAPTDEQAAATLISSILQPPRVPTPPVCPPLPRLGTPVRIQTPSTTVMGGLAGKSYTPLDLPTAVDEALEKLESMVSALPKNMRTTEIGGWTTITEEGTTDDEGGRDADDEESDPATAELAYPTGEGEEIATSLPPTPDDPSPTVSPLTTPPASPLNDTPTIAIPDATAGGPYNLRPRPMPRRRYRESPPPRGPTKRARHRARVGLDRPQLALQGDERSGLDQLLGVPARLWSRRERRFLRAILRSLKRAVHGGIGHGEGVESDESEQEMMGWQVMSDELEQVARARL
ncbi:hypothetical protein VTO73DRAFT_15412 [Trametes versicolor]